MCEGAGVVFLPGDERARTQLPARQGVWRKCRVPHEVHHALEELREVFRCAREPEGESLLRGEDLKGGGSQIQPRVERGAAHRRGGPRPAAGARVARRAARGAWRWQRGEREAGHPLLEAYLRPEPRLAAGEALRGLASSAIDVSDGLLADLQHVLVASGVGARLDLESLPLATPLRATLELDEIRGRVLNGGDDYELLVTLAESDLAEAQRRLAPLHLPLTPIGRIIEGEGIQGIPPRYLERSGWDHFPETAS
mgnify:CR=1 FL=1